MVFAVGSVSEDISSTGPTSDQSVSVAALRNGYVENRTSGIANSVLTAAALIANNAPTKERLPEGSTFSPSFVWGVSSIDPLLRFAPIFGEGDTRKEKPRLRVQLLLQRVNVRHEVCDLWVCEFASKSRHLVFSVLNYGDKINVRQLENVGRFERVRLHSFTGRRVAAAIGSMAHLALRNVDVSGILREAQSARRKYKEASGSVTDKMFQHV
jgi:hypothetical protein